MELGEGKLLRTGLNVLWQAVHPVHGLAWTDGSQVVLTDLQLHGGEAKFGDSTVMGKFEQVCGLSWAPSGTADMAALLAVQHKKHVTIWQLRPSTVGSSKWQLSQTTEMRQSQTILPQGCLWHPKIVVLAVLTARGVSILPDVHRGSSQITVNPNAQGRIHCACWTQDGRRLVVAVDSSLHSYIWDGTQRTLHQCPSCPVFQVDSYVRSITATVDSQVAIATELPLDKICSLNAFETFDVPRSGEDTGMPALSATGDLPSVDKGVATSETNSGVDVSPSLSDPLDLTHIRFSRSRAEESPLMCLRKRDYLTGTGQDASHLTLVTFKEANTVTRKTSIPGILVPDLIAFHLKRQIVAVASNTCNIILIYSVIPSALPNVQQIQLECNERPKGICFLTDKLLLILVGRRKSTETAFLPSSESDWYAIHLITREVRLGEESSATSSGSQSPCPAFDTPLSTAEGAEFTESLSFGFSCKTQGPLLTAHASGQSRKSGRTLIQEIKSPSSTISDGSLPMGTTLHRPSWVRTKLPRPSGTPNHTSTPEPPHLPQRENFPKEKEMYQLSQDLEILSRNVMEMQQYLFELMDFLHSEKKCAPAYPLSQDPPYIYIIYQKPCYVGPVEKRAVLLCDGKLRLSTVQRMFGLCLVEMLHDSHWILLSADSQGFIPLTFTDTQAIVVRDGSLSRPDASRDSPSHHQPPAPPPQGFGDLATQSLDKTGCCYPFNGVD